ncbi:MAG: DUF5666 domain-containing protein [Ktedonobacterales bacterium]
MKRSIIATAIVVTGMFGAGIAVGQIGGIPGSSAASALITTTTRQIAGVGATSTTPAAPDQGSHQDGAQDAPHADGTVTAINGDTLTISAGTDPAGTTEYTGVTTVALTSATQYDAGHADTGTISKSSITVGSYVIVDGTLSSDGKTLTATSLRINAGGPVAGR